MAKRFNKGEILKAVFSSLVQALNVQPDVAISVLDEMILTIKAQSKRKR